MKTVKQILEQYNTLELQEDQDNELLINLVRLGLLDKEKLSLLERSFKIDSAIMTEAEKNALIDLLKNVSSHMLFEAADDSKKLQSASSAKENSQAKQKQPPLILYFNRKSIRMFSDDIKVAVYYSKQLDKYISIPFGPKAAENLPQLTESIPNEKLVKYVSLRNRTSSLNVNHRQGGGEDYVKKNFGPRAALVNKEARVKNKKARELEDLRANAPSIKDRVRAGDYKGAGAKAGENIHNWGVFGAAGSIAQAARGAIARVRDRKKLEEGFLSSLLGTKKQTKSKVAKFKEVGPKPVKSKAKPLKAVKKEAEQKATEKSSKIRSSKRDVETYKRAKEIHDVATDRPIRVWDPDKRRHVDTTTKAHYKSLVDAAKKRLGGNVPDVPKKEKVKRDPNRKPPPVQAESYTVNEQENSWADRYVPGWKKSKEEVKSGAKKSLKGNLKDFAKKAPNALMAVGPGRAAVTGAVAGGKMVAGMSAAGKAAAAKSTAAKTVAKVGTGAGLIGGALKVGKEVIKGALKGSGKDKIDYTRKRSQGGTTTFRDDSARRARLNPDSASFHGREHRRSVPYTNVAESNINALKHMVEEKIPSLDISIGDNSVTINNRIARKVLSVYESLNRTNKKNMENMLNESVSSFKKVINFAIKAQNGK